MQQQITIKGHLVSYIGIKGKANAPVLFFLHGWRSQKEVWNPVIDKLLSTKHLALSTNIYALDFPGFGGSQNPKTDFHLQDYVNVAEGFIKKLDIKNLVLVGHSFGGRVAIKLCAQQPTVIKKLVLIDSAGFVFNPDKKQMMNLIAKTVKPFFRPKFMQPIRKIIYKTIGAEDYLATPELQKTFVNVVNEDLTEYLEKITLPTLIVWGEKDMETPFEFAQMMKNKIKNSELVVFEQAGHFSFLDEPERFVKELNKFISDPNTTNKHSNA